MSIQDKLNNTKSYLRSTRKAILGRGGEITEDAGLQDIADAIYNIPADTSLVYQTDEGVAYEKIVPAGAEEYAQVAKVGGMTYKCKNLLKNAINYGGVGATKVVNDVTLTVNNSTSVSLKGTATAIAHFVPTYLYLKAGTYTFSAYCSSTTSNSTVQAFLSNRNSEALASNVYLGASTSKSFTVVNDGEILVNIYVYLYLIQRERGCY